MYCLPRGSHETSFHDNLPASDTTEGVRAVHIDNGIQNLDLCSNILLVLGASELKVGARIDAGLAPARCSILLDATWGTIIVRCLQAPEQGSLQFSAPMAC
jgi:hypothetical protein